MEEISFDWEDATAYARLVQIAEAEPAATDKRTVTVPHGAVSRSYERLSTILANDLASSLNPKRREAIVPIGFVAQHADGELVLSLHGTRGVLEWLHDCEYKAVPCSLLLDAGHTEDGFTEMLHALRLASEICAEPWRARLLAFRSRSQ